jgi:hypothetical protein
MYHITKAHAIYALVLRVCALRNCGLYVFVCVCVTHPADAVVRICSLYIHIYLNAFVDVYVCEFEISHLLILSPDSRPYIFSLLYSTV